MLFYQFMVVSCMVLNLVELGLKILVTQKDGIKSIEKNIGCDIYAVSELRCVL